MAGGVRFAVLGFDLREMTRSGVVCSSSWVLAGFWGPVFGARGWGRFLLGILNVVVWHQLWVFSGALWFWLFCAANSSSNRVRRALSIMSSVSLARPIRRSPSEVLDAERGQCGAVFEMRQ